MKIDENKVSNLQKSLYVPINQSLFTESEKEIEYSKLIQEKGINGFTVQRYISKKEREFLKNYIINPDEANIYLTRPDKKFNDLIESIKNEKRTAQKKDEQIYNEVKNKQEINGKELSKKINVSRTTIHKKIGKEKDDGLSR